jgi:hypothetical protein
MKDTDVKSTSSKEDLKSHAALSLLLRLRLG